MRQPHRFSYRHYDQIIIANHWPTEKEQPLNCLPNIKKILINKTVYSNGKQKGKGSILVLGIIQI